MDQLEQALERLEQDLDRVLESSSDPKIRTLLGDIKSLKGAREILRRQASSSFVDPYPANPTMSTNGHGHATPMTQGDAAFEILHKAGPLHISKILAEMPKYGITTATKVNLNSLLVKDRRARFVNKGQATFDINPNARKATEHKQKPLLGLPPGFSLTASIQALLPELKGEFSQPTIYKMLTERHPNAAERIQRASISTTLSKLVERNLIEVTHQGFGSDPRRYRTKGR